MIFSLAKPATALAMALAYWGAVLCASVGIPPTSAKATQVNGWSARTEGDGNVCILTYSADSVSLYVYRDIDTDDLYIAVPQADLPYEFQFNWKSDIGPDRILRAAAYEDAGLYRVHSDPDIPVDDLLLELEPASSLTLSFAKRVSRVITLPTFTKAFADYRKCAARFQTRQSVQSDDVEEPNHNNTAEESDEPADLAETLKTMPTTVVGEFLCEVSSSDLLGILDFNGNDQSTTVTLSIFEDGSATYNGRPVQPEVNQKADDGTIAFVTYDVRTIIKAAGADPSVPPVAGLSQDEMNAYGAFLGAGNAMMLSVLGDRSRSLFVSLKDGTVVFLDHKNGREISNQRAPQCIRTQ